MAIEHFAEILADLERSEKSIKSVSLPETPASTDQQSVTGQIRMRIPLLQDSCETNDVLVEATNADIVDGSVDVTLSVSLPIPDKPTERASHSIGRSAQTESSAPTYKDPEVLQCVYDEYDSFPAMTEALGVNVTSETVRRYMVKYGIHDPDADDARSSPKPDAADGGEDSLELISADTPPEEGTDTTEPLRESRSEMEAAQLKTGGAELAAESEKANDETDATDSSEAPDDALPVNEERGTEADVSAESTYADCSVAVLVEQNAETNESLIADGSGVPQDLTVGELASILDRARTITEMSRALDLEYKQTRRLLNELGVIEFVSGRLTNQADQVTVSNVLDRMGIDGSVSAT